MLAVCVSVLPAVAVDVARVAPAAPLPAGRLHVDRTWRQRVAHLRLQAPLVGRARRRHTRHRRRFADGERNDTARVRSSTVNTYQKYELGVCCWRCGTFWWRIVDPVKQFLHNAFLPVFKPAVSYLSRYSIQCMYVGRVFQSRIVALSERVADLASLLRSEPGSSGGATAAQTNRGAQQHDAEAPLTHNTAQSRL